MMDFNGYDCNDDGDYHCEGQRNNSSKIIILTVSVNMSKTDKSFMVITSMLLAVILVSVEMMVIMRVCFPAVTTHCGCIFTAR
jgi:hypothetical protein